MLLNLNNKQTIKMLNRFNLVNKCLMKLIAK